MKTWFLYKKHRNGERLGVNKKTAIVLTVRIMNNSWGFLLIFTDFCKVMLLHGSLYSTLHQWPDPAAQ